MSLYDILAKNPFVLFNDFYKPLFCQDIPYGRAFVKQLLDCPGLHDYWREYRTFAHIAASFGLDESNMYRSIKWMEDVLIKDGTFALPGKKALLQSDRFDAVLIDATESPIERPKKDSGETIPAKRNGTR